MPQFLIEAPIGIGDEAKRKMADRIDAAIAEASAGLANTDQTLILVRVC
jgi:hypothetical protein